MTTIVYNEKRLVDDVWLSVVTLAAINKDVEIYPSGVYDKPNADYRISTTHYNNADNGVYGSKKWESSIITRILLDFGYGKLADSSAIRYIDAKAKNGITGAYDETGYKINNNIINAAKIMIMLPMSDVSVQDVTGQLLDWSKTESFKPEEFTYKDLLIWYLDRVSRSTLNRTLQMNMKLDKSIEKQISDTKVAESKTGVRVGILDDVPIRASSVLKVLKLDLLITRSCKYSDSVAIFRYNRELDIENIVSIILEADSNVSLTNIISNGYLTELDVSKLTDVRMSIVDYIYSLIRNYI